MKKASFETMPVSDSDEESSTVSSSDEGEIWKGVSGESFNLNLKHSSKQFKKQSKNFLNLNDCINANNNCDPLSSCLVIQSKYNFDKSKYKVNSSTQEDLVPLTFGELIPII